MGDERLHPVLYRIQFYVAWLVICPRFPWLNRYLKRYKNRHHPGCRVRISRRSNDHYREMGKLL